MPRRVLTVDASHIRKHRLDTEAGRQDFLRGRQPHDHHAWVAELHDHPGGGQFLVLDHLEPETDLSELAPHALGGSRLEHRSLPKTLCAEPGCETTALHGQSHCEAHLQPTPGYR